MQLRIVGAILTPFSSCVDHVGSGATLYRSPPHTRIPNQPYRARAQMGIEEIGPGLPTTA